MTPAELSSALLSVLDAAVASGELDIPAERRPTSVTIERPRSPEHGDYATNVALQLAKAAGRAPREVATVLAGRIQALPGIAAVDIAGPGFLNITLEAAAQGELARTIVGLGDQYGRHGSLAGRRINLEFVSANPTGPIHMGGTRWAAVGDSLARILAASGAEVEREYYFNDHGAQIDRFARSLLARARGREIPGDGYAGQYIDDIAARVAAEAQAQGLTFIDTRSDIRAASAKNIIHGPEDWLHFNRIGYEVLARSIACNMASKKLWPANTCPP